MKHERIAPVENEPGRFVFYCPGCDAWHWFSTCLSNEPTWHLSGTCEKPTLRPGVTINAADEVGIHRCHSLITDGCIRFSLDSTHSLAGQTIALPPALFPYDLADD